MDERHRGREGKAEWQDQLGGDQPAAPAGGPGSAPGQVEQGRSRTWEEKAVVYALPRRPHNSHAQNVLGSVGYRQRRSGFLRTA